EATNHHRELAHLNPKLGKLLSARYSLDGNRIALGFSSGAVLITDGSLGSPRRVLDVKDAAVNRVAFSPDGTTLAAALADGTVRLVDIGSATTTATLGAAGADAVNGVDIDAAGDVATADDGGKVTLWSEGKPRTIATESDVEHDVRFS